MAILNNLIVHGSSRFLNIAQFNALKTNTIGADKGVFNKLIATDATFDSLDVEDLTAQNATVVGLLDVKGELHSNSWTNSNIATIDGSFYITPTVSCTSGTFAYNGTSITVTAASGQSFGIDSLYTSTTDGTVTTYTTWPQYSKVLLTGEVKLNGSNEWMPLGTIRGQINSSSTSSIQINSLYDSQGTTPIATLVALGSTSITNATFRNVKVSLYERASSSSSFFPMGIYMTALGAKGKTFIDIYGGGNAKGSIITESIDSGAMASPVLRIGNLSGLPKVGTITPKGWGIYTTNGFFTGTVVAQQGKIGNGATAWTIGSGSGTGSVSYIYAPTNGPTTKTANTIGMYVGTDGINNFNTSSQYVRIYDGKIYAQGADISGTIDATSFTAKNYTGTTLNRQMSLGADGLKLMDGSGTILSQIDGSASTIGKTSGNSYNINITGTDIDLRYNTNVLNRINNSGMTLYDGDGVLDNNILAKFNTNSAQIGQSGKSHIEMDYHSLQMIDGDTKPHVFFHVSDLRDENNEYAYTDTFIGNGTTQYFTLSYSAKRGAELSVTVSDGSGGEAHLDPSISLWLVFETAPTDGATITVTYITSSYFAKAYTLGMRKANSVIGPLSTCFGLNCVASESRSFAEGWYAEANGAGSHAEGYKTKANGNYSHAQGYETVANRAYQVAIGRFNEIDNYGSNASTRGKYVFIIGNGTADDARSNALTVDWYGNITINNHDSEIGHVYSASKSVAISNTDINHNTDGASLTLSAGVYIVIGQWYFNTRTTTGTTNSAIRMYRSSDNYANNIAQQRMFSATNAWSCLQCTAIVELTSTETIKVCGATSRPYTTAQATFINAVRIK